MRFERIVSEKRETSFDPATNYGDFMREGYDIGELRPRKNPFAEQLKKHDLPNIESNTPERFVDKEEIPTSPNKP